MGSEKRRGEQLYSRYSAIEAMSLKMPVYLLHLGFEKADLLLGEVFKAEASAEVSLESRSRRMKR